MSFYRATFAGSLLALSLAGCTLAPANKRPALPVANDWSVDTPATTTASLSWQDVFTDARLKSVIELARTHNRDLRVAVLNIDKARAAHATSLSLLLPSLNLTAARSQSRSSGATSSTGTTGYSDIDTANVALSPYEIDLFGRIRSLSRSANETLKSTADTQKAVEISLIASVAQGWLTVAADGDLLRLSEATLKARSEALEIGTKRYDVGSLSEVDLNTLKSLAAQARADAASARTRLDGDLSTLTLLVGTTLPADLIPTGLEANAGIAEVPVGVPSEVLIKRPDITAAEHALRAQNANIGAARAAFLPRLSLTGTAGAASTEFSTLFDGNTHTYSFTPSLTLPLFAGGANVAALKTARVNRDIAVAQYEKAIQSAFNEVNQALSVKVRIDERATALDEVSGAATRNLDLVKARYAQGVDGYLALLDSERNAYTAQSNLISIRLLRESNKVALYKALGTQ
jgi:outer membrane protein, multidrug efflux system